MTPEERRYELECVVRELERRKQRNKIDQFYPTPENRAGYKVHMAFFEAGKAYRQRLALAANRVGKCVSGETLIESPYGVARPVKEIKGPHWVWAWDGSKKVPALAEQPFTKTPQRLYRVFFQDGHWIDCAMEHRFLSESGWLFLEDLLQSVPCLPGSSSEFSPLASLADVQYYLRKVPSYQDDYQSIYRSYGEQLPLAANTGLASLPSLSDAAQRTLAWLHSGDLVGKCKYNLSKVVDHLSSFYEVLQVVGQNVVVASHSACYFGIPNLRLHQESLQFSIAQAFQQQQDSLGFHNRAEETFALLSPDGGKNKILAYQPLEIAELYDFTVPEFGNYCTLGTINHNTEGMGGYETVLHLTGNYPDWWNGKRFDKPGEWWIGGTTATTVRDIIQTKLLGNVGSFGTGLIPGHLIIDTSNKRGVPDAVENIYIRHRSGGKAVAQLKSYDQGREAWQGTEKQGIWLDEEPPMGIYTEALTRTMTTNGIVLCTFTPMDGMSDVVVSFLDPDKPDSRFVCTATWDDAPHLDEAAKQELLMQYPIHERDARTKGIPTIGVGKIYPVNVEDMLVDPFDLPKYWPRGYALDVGWNKTAALWGALDRDSDILYLYSEHYQGMAEPAVHASAIKARGEMMGYIDPASMGGSQVDGEKLINLYRAEGLKLFLADNKGKEAAIFDIFQRMTSGRLKIFRTLINIQKELPLYHRDVNGHIVKKNDHLLDCFHGETKVVTDIGEVSIKDLVGTTGFVLSSDGEFHHYRDCKKYRSESELVKITLNDGREISCTPDHLFLNSGNQWVMAKDLLNVPLFKLREENCQLKSSMIPSKNSMAKFIGSAENIFKDMVNGCTEKFGKVQTVRYLKGLLSTTVTITRKITIYPTWNLWTAENTCPITLSDGQTKESMLQSRQQKHGMAQKKEKNGIGNITNKLKMQCTENGSGIATTAARITKLWRKVIAGSAQTNAKRHGARNQESMTFKKLVSVVASNLPRININRDWFAVPIAERNTDLLYAVKIEQMPNGDSYCLTVDDTHNFAVCGGVIVHNCLRYLCLAIPTLTYFNEKEGHYTMTQNGVQYRTSRPTKRYANDY